MKSEIAARMESKSRSKPDSGLLLQRVAAVIIPPLAVAAIAAGALWLRSLCKQDMVVPEPGSMIVLALGGIGLIIRRGRHA